MKVTIVQTTTKTLTLERVLLTSITKESFLLEPDEGKNLKDLKTGKIYPLGLCIVREKDIANFEEIDAPKDSQ